MWQRRSLCQMEELVMTPHTSATALFRSMARRVASGVYSTSLPRTFHGGLLFQMTLNKALQPGKVPALQRRARTLATNSATWTSNVLPRPAPPVLGP